MEKKQTKNEILNSLREIEQAFWSASRYSEDHFSGLENGLLSSLEQLKNFVSQYHYVQIDGLKKHVIEEKAEINGDNYSERYKSISGYIDSLVSLIKTIR